MSEQVSGPHVSVQNKAIDEYFRCALTGVIAADAGNRQPEFIAAAAMKIAVAAYERRCEILGATFSKNL